MAFSTASTEERKLFRNNILLKILSFMVLTYWVSTFLFTPNRANWYTENALTILAMLVLFVTYTKFKFSDLSYTLFGIYLLLHMYGAEYTYAENPFGFWLRDTFSLGRNYYDRIVHFSFGFLLTYPMREYFKNYFNWPNWVCWVLPCEITLSFSGMYELIEWLVADIFFPAEGIAYLGSQGDIWDAQKDMSIAFIGSILAVLVIASTRKYFLKKTKEGI
jgi:putative membrane protein